MGEGLQVGKAHERFGRCVLMEQEFPLKISRSQTLLGHPSGLGLPEGK